MGSNIFDEAEVRRFRGLLGFPFATVAVVVGHVHVESLELETGTSFDSIAIGGNGSAASLTVNGNLGADQFYVTGEAFAKLHLRGDFPTHAPGDLLHMTVPAGLDGYHHPDPYVYRAGTASIGASYLTYAGIETVELEDFTNSHPNDLVGDFDGDGKVDGNDLTNPVVGLEARFGNDLGGNSFLDWQRNYGQKVDDGNEFIVPLSEVAALSEEIGEQEQAAATQLTVLATFPMPLLTTSEMTSKEVCV